MFMHGGIAHICREHALSLDLRRQHRKRARTPALPHVLPRMRRDRIAVPRLSTSRSAATSYVPSSGRRGAISGVLGATSFSSRAAASRMIMLRTIQEVPALGSHRDVVRIPDRLGAWGPRRRVAGRRRRIRRPHRRLHRRAGPRQGLRRRKTGDAQQPRDREERRCLRHSPEIDESALDVGLDELDAEPLADVHAFEPAPSLPSTGGWSRRTQVPFSEAPVTMRVELLADPSIPAAARRRTCRPAARPCWRRPPASVQCVASASSSSVLVGRRASRQRGLQQALGDQVGVAAVGGGGVGVVLDGQAEVPGGVARRAARPRIRRRPAA